MNLIKKRGRYSPFTESFLREPGEALRKQIEDNHECLLEAFYQAFILSIICALIIVTFPEIPLAFILVFLTILIVYYSIKLTRLFND